MQNKLLIMCLQKVSLHLFVPAEVITILSGVCVHLGTADSSVQADSDTSHATLTEWCC